MIIFVLDQTTMADPKGVQWGYSNPLKGSNINFHRDFGKKTGNYH
jgi:hypothetical protein